MQTAGGSNQRLDSPLQLAARPSFPSSKPSSSNTKLERDLTPPSVLQPPCLSDSIPIECKPTQCIFCVGCEGLPTEARLKSFHSHCDLKKHFYRKHLRHHPDGQPIICPHPRCKATLKGKIHLQNHAELMHKILT